MHFFVKTLKHPLEPGYSVQSKVHEYNHNLIRVQSLSKSTTSFILFSIQDDPIVWKLDKTVSVTPSMSKSETGGKHRGAFKQLR